MVSAVSRGQGQRSSSCGCFFRAGGLTEAMPSWVRARAGREVCACLPARPACLLTRPTCLPACLPACLPPFIEGIAGNGKRVFAYTRRARVAVIETDACFFLATPGSIVNHRGILSSRLKTKCFARFGQLRPGMQHRRRRRQTETPETWPEAATTGRTR